MTSKTYRVVVLILILATLLSACALPGAKPAAKKKLVIYTAKENEEITEYLPVAKKALPDLELEVLRLSTGDLTARLLAEKNNPQADVIWGVAATSMMIFEREGMLEAYAPKGADAILAQFKDPHSPPHWVGVDAYVNAFCVNTEKAKEFNLPTPQSWEDLTKPVYKGHIVMPNPASSGTGYMFVSSVLQGLGWEKGWDFLARLHKNIAIYTKSGSKPCKLAAAGEYPIAISFAFVAAKLKKDGAPLEMVFPKEGSGYEVEANGLIKGTDNPEGAKRFLDWAVSDEAMQMYAKYFAVVAKPGFKPPEGMPSDVADRLFPMDFTWSSENRDKILEEWTKRFAEKTEGQ